VSTSFHEGRARVGRRSIVVLVSVAVLIAGVAAVVAARRHARAKSSDQLHFQGSDVRPPDGAHVTVEVFNATPRRGLGRRAMFYLRDRGFDVVSLGTAHPGGDTTVVVARGAHADWARLVARALGTTRIEVRPDSLRDVDVSVYIGSAWRPPPQPFYP
jgi:hypothetical protein